MKRQTSLQDLVRLTSSLAQNLFVGSLPLSQNKGGGQNLGLGGNLSSQPAPGLKPLVSDKLSGSTRRWLSSGVTFGSTFFSKDQLFTKN